MISYLAKCLNRIIPNSIYGYFNKNDKKIQFLFCEKLIIIISLFVFYITLIIIFIYFVWKECTNILDINANLNTTLFKRNSDYCNAMDGLFVFYITFLIFILGFNVIIGIIYNYYRKYKNNQVSKNNNIYNDKIIVHIPLYNEDLEIIESTINSISSLNYNLDNILILIVVDGIILNNTLNKTIDYILLEMFLKNNEYIEDNLNNNIYNDTIKYKNNNLKIYNGDYNKIKYSVILKCGNNSEIGDLKRGNRGKKDSALIIYETLYYINNFENIPNEYLEIHNNMIDNLNNYKYILIVDCDTDLEYNSLIILVDYLNNNNNTIAVCGQTIVKNKDENFITIVQYFEYFITHLLLKTFENILFNVLVLSGCFTLLRLKDSDNNVIINLNILDKYTKEASGIIEKNLVELGEDRYLTDIIIIEYPQYKLGYLPDSHCYTNVPNTNRILIDQRRRWTNSLIACSLYLLSNANKQNIIKKIRMYIVVLTELFIVFILPIIIIMGFISTFISLTIQGFSYEPFIITIFVIFLNLIIALIMKRCDMILPFFSFLIYLPIFSIYIPIYSICNLDNLKWGLTRDIDNDEIVSNDEMIEMIEIITPR